MTAPRYTPEQRAEVIATLAALIARMESTTPIATRQRAAAWRRRRYHRGGDDAR